MTRAKKFLDSRFGFAFISNLITLIISLVLFRPFWEECDDINMALLAEGAYGLREPHILYSNIIYGKIICILQAIIPSVRWHAVLMYLFTFIISTAFVYILAKDKKGRILSVVFLAAAFYETYVSFQFSKVATIIAVLSYLILFEQIKAGKPQKTLVSVAFTCMFYAIILRYESFLLATLVAGAYGACLLINDLIRKDLKSKLKSYCKYFIPVFVLFFICYGVHLYSYSLGGWKTYMDHFNSTTQMVDYHYNSLLYDLHGAELESLGVSENDAMMLITYQGGMDFPGTGLADRITALDKVTVNLDFVKAWAANICEEFFAPNSLIIAFIMLIGLLISYISYEGSKNVYIGGVLLQILLTAVILFYYQYSNRWSHRIVYALLLAQFGLIVYVIGNTKTSDISRTVSTIILSAVVFCVIGLRFGNEFSYNEYSRNVYDYGQLISYMEDNKNKLFVSDVFTMLDYGKYDVFKASDIGQFDNYLSTDSVTMAATPVNTSIASGFGYNDPLEALTARDDRVILIDSISPETELTYCNEHGDGSEYTLDELEPVGNVSLYHIR